MTLRIPRRGGLPKGSQELDRATLRFQRSGTHY